MKRRALLLTLALFTLSCVGGGPNLINGSTSVDQDVSTEALASEMITSQPLDAMAPMDASPEVAASADPAEPAFAPLIDEVIPKPDPEVIPDPVAELPSSATGQACIKQGGLWTHAGKSVAYTCVKATKDSGKQCSKATQCQGYCLARSKTCAPYTPLFGCNEILQDDGSRVTICID